MKYNIGIDVSRASSGGVWAHITGILNAMNELPNEVNEVHIWAYKSLYESLPNYPWLIKHSPKVSEKSLLKQLWWQYRKLPLEANKFEVDILLNIDAGSVCPFRPAVTMSRDMLSYEKGEMKRFGFSVARLRLIVLKYVQCYSLRNSEGVIFLTKYASDIIQGKCGKIQNKTIIPHGINKVFRVNSNNGIWNKKTKEPIKCIYVSSVFHYKHPWNVVKAISFLRKAGYNLSITFVGGGSGKAQKIFENEINIADPEGKYIEQLDYVSHEKISKLLEKADVFIFASSCENMPNTLIEGMAAGLPIACSNRGPMPEVLKNGGIYFDPEDCISIANAIEIIIENEEKRIKIAKKAKELSTQYSWSRCSKETFDYLIKTFEKIENN